MALTGNIKRTNNFGAVTELKGVHIQIVEIASTKQSALSTVLIRSKEGGVILAEEHYPFTPDYSEGAGNHIQQAYKALKGLPEFSNVKDC